MLGLTFEDKKISSLKNISDFKITERKILIHKISILKNRLKNFKSKYILGGKNLSLEIQQKNS